MGVRLNPVRRGNVPDADDKPRHEWSYVERRAEILEPIERAGQPDALTKTVSMTPSIHRPSSRATRRRTGRSAPSHFLMGSCRPPTAAPPSALCSLRAQPRPGVAGQGSSRCRGVGRAAGQDLRCCRLLGWLRRAVQPRSPKPLCVAGGRGTANHAIGPAGG